MDIALDWNGEKFDLKVADGDLVMDDGLATAVAISLFTDRRVSEEELPAEETDRRGWWGDLISEDLPDQIGSKLWLLKREKHTPETARRAKEYAEEALQWILDDNIAQSVSVSTEWISSGYLQIKVSIQKGKNEVAFLYNRNWSSELSRNS